MRQCGNQGTVAVLVYCLLEPWKKRAKLRISATNSRRQGCARGAPTGLARLLRTPQLLRNAMLPTFPSSTMCHGLPRPIKLHSHALLHHAKEPRSRSIFWRVSALFRPSETSRAAMTTLTSHHSNLRAGESLRPDLTRSWLGSPTKAERLCNSNRAK